MPDAAPADPAGPAGLTALLPLLACPSDDHAPLELVDGELVCTVCASRFGFDGRVPVLLPAEAVPGPNGLGVPA